MRGAARALADCPPATWQRVQGVLTDVDDTLTANGVLEPAAEAALHALAAHGVPVVAVTGRPLGWSAPCAAAWPVRAIVAENGGAALVRGPGGAVRTVYAQDPATRAANARRLRAVAARIAREVPGATPARDSAGRATDLAIDHAEHARLAPAAVARVLELMRDAGMNATVSSIHVNGWFGAHDKASGAAWMLRELFGRELDDAEAARWCFVGDSPNDEALFSRIPLSVGVANLLDFADRLRAWPAWITVAPRGRGFAEVVRALLAARVA